MLKKRKESRKKGGMGNLPDRLSDLPLGIIHEILARVPIRDAIRTCILSKQWSQTWTTLHRLVFLTAEADWERIEEDGLMKEYTESTENFVSNVLLHHKGPIYRFQISLNISIGNIEKWMLCLSRKDIRELSISVDRDKIDGVYVRKNLKSSIYSFEKLTTLLLGGCTFHPPPSSFKGFLALTSLRLVYIGLYTDEVQSLISCCPLLERLDIVNCSCSEFRIRSPNLKRLFLSGKQGKLSFYAPLLAEIRVHCPLSAETETVVCNYTNPLGCLTNLVKLSGDGCFIRYLSIGIDSCHHALVFHHLRVIELVQLNLADTKQQSVVARLIFGAPDLHKLLLGVCDSLCGSDADAPCVSFEDFGCESNFRLEKLRKVSLYRVCDYRPRFGMHLIKLLVESSPVLETVNVVLISPKMATELQGFLRRSSNARLSFSGQQEKAKGYTSKICKGFYHILSSMFTQTIRI